MRVLHLSYSDLAGGAARAAYRIHRALIGSGIDSRMLVREKISTDPTVSQATEGLGGSGRILQRRLSNLLLRLQRSPDHTLRSLNLFRSNMPRQLDLQSADIINLHWVGLETMSVAEIGRISKPVVWTLHDMWAFCGSEHYARDAPDARHREGYRADNRVGGASGIDLDRWTWNRKRRAWRRPYHVVCPSRWLAGCTRGSALMSTWPVDVIPNPIDCSLYAPQERRRARVELGLPPHAKVLLFGAAGGVADPRKGFRHLLAALQQFHSQERERTVLALFGGHMESAEPPAGFRVQEFGHIDDERKMAMLYGAADAFVAPSEMDNLPNTVVEALACGTPVVGFDVGGMPDMVTSGREGHLCRPFDASELAAGIRAILDHPSPQSLRDAARSRALQMFGEQRIALKYQELYERVLGEREA